MTSFFQIASTLFEKQTMGKTNVVYDPETNEDRPLFFCCCGRNCPLNARYWFLALTILGIAASIWTCESAEYFSFTSLRNDTFYDLDKKQPEPFQFATEADVGMFKYRINAVFVYPELDELNEGSEVDINQDIQEGSNIGQVQSYELGADQFDSDRAFSTAQKGAFIGPIMAGVSLFFCLIEVCFVQYPCSWLPTAFFMFMAFTFQLFTVFLFLSEDFW